MFILKYILFFIVLFNPLNTQIYDFSDFPNEDESFTTADFRIYISEEIDTIRGIYAYMHGFGGDSRSIVQDSLMQELAKTVNFALLGVRLDNMYMDSGIGNSLIEAKSSFAEQSNHLELIYSPLFFDGHSWGGQWSYHYTQWNPEDVIAFVTMKGGYHDTTYSESVINVPGYMFVGENDSDYRIKNLTDNAKYLLDDLPDHHEDEWLGFRPTLPDYLPVIGPSKNYKNVFYSFGHHHLGWTLGAISGKIISKMISNENTNLDLKPYSSLRFS